MFCSNLVHMVWNIFLWRIVVWLSRHSLLSSKQHVLCKLRLDDNRSHQRSISDFALLSLVNTLNELWDILVSCNNGQVCNNGLLVKNMLHAKICHLWGLSNLPIFHRKRFNGFLCYILWFQNKCICNW